MDQQHKEGQVSRAAERAEDGQNASFMRSGVMVALGGINRWRPVGPGLLMPADAGSRPINLKRVQRRCPPPDSVSILSMLFHYLLTLPHLLEALIISTCGQLPPALRAESFVLPSPSPQLLVSPFSVTIRVSCPV